jgi:PBSX family phage terminase large subunit
MPRIIEGTVAPARRAPRLQYGPRMERFAMRPPELDAKINILVGAVRSGKTWGLMSKILYGCKYDVGGRRILTGVSKASVRTNVLEDLFALVGPANYKFNAQSGELNLFGVPWWCYGAKDEGSEKYLRGATVGYAVCDELVLHPRPFFEMLLSRLSPPGSRLYASTNADSASHWLRTEYLLNEELVGDGTLWTDAFTMDDNVTLEPSYVADQKKLYTGVFYDRMILGRWNNAAGAVYGDAWSEDETLYDDDTRPLGLYNQGGFEARYIGVDYGTHNPTVFLDVIDDGHTLWFDREFYHDSRRAMAQKTDAAYRSDLAKFIADSPCTMKAPMVLVDPSAASFKAELEQNGDFWQGSVDNTVLDGIRRMGSALKQRKIRVHKRNCPNTVREVPEYAWDAKAAKLGKEQPMKVADHTCDAARYVVNEVFKSWRLAA